MRQKYIVALLFVLSLVAIGVGYIVWRVPDVVGICDFRPTPEMGHCVEHDFLVGIIHPITELIYIPTLFLILFFVRHDVFKLWWKFALPFGLLLFFLVANHGLGGDGFLSFSRSEYTRPIAMWFVVTSLLLIALKTWRPRWKAYVTIPFALIAAYLGVAYLFLTNFLGWVLLM